MKTKLSKNQIMMLAGAFFINAAAYIGGRLISQNFRHFCLVTSWDLKIPLLPWTALIYLGCYLFWIVNYCISIKYDQENGYRFWRPLYWGSSLLSLLCVLPNLYGSPGN